MMAELVQKISEKTSLPPDKAQEVVNVVMTHLRERLPAPIAGALDNYLATGSVGSGDLAGEAKAMAAEIGSMFGKQSQ
jgi:uncharacterized protein (DUF2267 family)